MSHSPPTDPDAPTDLSASGLTLPSDSEPFSSLSPPSSSNNRNNTDDRESREQKVVIYSKPTFWSLVRGAAINLLLPFVNGMMLGLGELLAHEIAFRWGWGTTQVSLCRHENVGKGSDGLQLCARDAAAWGQETFRALKARKADHWLDIPKTQIIANGRARSRDAGGSCGEEEKRRQGRSGLDECNVFGMRIRLLLVFKGV
jgi:Outer membrane protein TOM13